jgi:hypothetical protein
MDKPKSLISLHSISQSKMAPDNGCNVVIDDHQVALYIHSLRNVASGCMDSWAI